MAHLSIRDLQKISGEAIAALPGPTAVKSGDRTVGLLLPVRRADLPRLEAVLREAEAMAQSRDPGEDEAFLRAEFGEVDTSDWSFEAVRDLMQRPR